MPAQLGSHRVQKRGGRQNSQNDILWAVSRNAAQTARQGGRNDKGRLAYLVALGAVDTPATIAARTLPTALD